VIDSYCREGGEEIASGASDRLLNILHRERGVSESGEWREVAACYWSFIHTLYITKAQQHHQFTMSAAQPYLVSDEDDDTINDSDSELELLDYGKQHHFASEWYWSTLTSIVDSDSSEPEIISVHVKETPSAASGASSTNKQGRTSKPLKNGPVHTPYAEIGSYRFNKGCVIKPGDTVELMDHSSHEADSMHSGDFLRIKHIIFNLETDKVKLRGWRMRRTKYLGQIFDCKVLCALWENCWTNTL
jgi:hypothetical protein